MSDPPPPQHLELSLELLARTTLAAFGWFLDLASAG